MLHLRAGKWVLVSSGLSKQTEPTGIAAPSAKSIWAVGFLQGTPPKTTPLLARSSGGRFRVITPHGLGDGELTSVAAASAADAWAAGFTGQAEAASPKIRPLALHWNGRKWSASSFTSPAGLVIGAIATDSASRAWIVGAVTSESGQDGYAARWNGSRWTSTTVPQSHEFSGPAGVTMSGRDAWAVGEKLVNTTTSRIDPQILRWNGRKWSAQHTPNPAGQPSDGQSGLTAVSASATKFAVAVGDYFVDGGGCGPAVGEAAVYRDGSWREAKLPAPKSGPANHTRPACGG